MKITDFDTYSNLLKEKSGLVLSQDQVYVLESRLSPVSKKWGYASLEAMTLAMQGVPDQQLVQDVVESMTSNETSFFRDLKPFDVFKDVLLPIMKEQRSKQRRVRIWCAAASSGQEPYSLAMLINEVAADFPGWTFEILATDISNEILDQAREGLYSQFEVQRGLPIALLVKYFTQIDQKWQISDKIKNMVKFQSFNLLNPMQDFGEFDIIFCRNVLTFFDESTKAAVLENISKQLKSDSFLVLGNNETATGLTDALTPVLDRFRLFAPTDSPHSGKSDIADAQALA